MALLLTLAGSVGQLSALAAEPEPPSILLAERYRGEVDVGQYWVSEKLDGVRAVWDGRILRFRSGNPVPAPQWFLDPLPGQPLDGELWLGRSSFDRLSAIVRRQQPDDSEWRRVLYMIFELPEASGSFTDRVEKVRVLTAKANLPWLRAVPQFRLPDDAALRTKLDEVVRGGGEGLMLHRADAAYETGRSSALLKLTPWQDAEAVVVAHLPGKGKYAGMLGALRMEMGDGRRFALGSGLSDALRRNAPPPGTLVTYRYRELTPNGMPRFPRYLRVRDGL
ncbi:DNA ligase [Sulfuritalea sp.]|uniref:DNA ligase n=1 Tax=Sulfuritalea sp. TaxID=2480090 RepID=UPI001AC9CD9E|nr:DNA ligase [Sulfuritalea sp.]MBN8473919.1 DNA ligase [Sulfuritalea sp.]